DPVNVGCGEDISIRDLAILIRDAVGYTGDIRWDTSRPDGTPRKLLDVATLTAMGWQPSVRLEDGIAELYKWYLDRNA
ncbi:MAG: GDP-L-fucose synthase, partial [Actinobacteria bacterium]|nr:GDP-L-fucose synthase [Actinomycetota bacterium]